jgi:hypothetical protein
MSYRLLRIERYDTIILMQNNKRSVFCDEGDKKRRKGKE